jgi:two-component system, OmpR family, sensor histidine kinase VicK
MNDPNRHPVESTKIINGIDIIQEDWKEFAFRAKKLDVYFDKNAITIATQTSTYRDTYIALKKKGVETRIITEITKENLHKSKVLAEIVGQLRHLENSHGAMAVSDTEFKATSYLPKDAHVPQAIVSNNMEFVKQQQYIFDILWRTATPAELRFKEIEEGVTQYKTEIITNQDEIISVVKTKYSNAKELLLCLNSGGLQVIYNNYLNSILKTLENERLGIGKGVRIMTFINTENIDLVKKFLKLGIKIRHVIHLPPLSFSCSEKHTFLTVEEMKDGAHATRLLSSNESTFLNHFASIFERFWKTGIDAKNRIVDIERGGSAEDVEIIYNTSEAKDLYVQLIKSAQKEIKIIYPTANAFLRQKKLDVPQMIIDAAKRGVVIRIIASNSEKIEEFFAAHEGLIQIRFLEKPSETKTTFLIIDNKYTLDLEIKDDSNMLFEEAVGFST